MDNNIKHKMIRIREDFSDVAEYLKQELTNDALQGDVEHFKTVQIEYKHYDKIVSRFNNIEGI